MAAISYDMPVSIDPDWGVENLRKASEAGCQLTDVSREDMRNS